MAGTIHGREQWRRKQPVQPRRRCFTQKGGNSGGRCWSQHQQRSELHTPLLPKLTNHLCSGTRVTVPISLMPYRSQPQLHQVEGPFTCTALRTVYQEHQDHNSFCKDVMKLQKKSQFRVHWDSLASSYWRRCSFHCRFLLSFGGISNSGSERQTGQVSEQGNSSMVSSGAVNYLVYFYIHRTTLRSL